MCSVSHSHFPVTPHAGIGLDRLVARVHELYHEAARKASIDTADRGQLVASCVANMTEVGLRLF